MVDFVSKALSGSPEEVVSKKLSKKVFWKRSKQQRRVKNSDDGGMSSRGLLADAKNDALGVVLPGVAAYSGTRFLYYIVQGMTGKLVRAGKHINILSQMAILGAVWYAGRRVRSFRPYAIGAVAGTAVAVIQAVIQTYLPQLSYLVGLPPPSNSPGMIDTNEMPSAVYPEDTGGHDDLADADLANGSSLTDGTVFGDDDVG